MFFSLQVRAIGTSNDTPYGITKMAQLGERLGYPRVASVQVRTCHVIVCGDCSGAGVSPIAAHLQQYAIVRTVRPAQPSRQGLT